MKITYRALVSHFGRHRAAAVPERIDVPLDDLIGPSSWYTTPHFADVPAHGVLTEAWRPCRKCGQEMPSVLHKDGWTCGHCFSVTVTGGAS